MAYNVTIASAATFIKTAGPGEQLDIVNSGPAVVYISNNSGVTTTTGFELPPGSELHLYNLYNFAGASGGLYGIVASGTGAVSINGLAT